MNYIVQAKELSCFYGMVLGLNNVSFNLGSGITGLVGPNGAGKSTLIKLMTGQIKPSSGQLLVFGQKPWNNPQILSRIGYCPEHEYVHKEMLPIDWLRSLAMLSGIPFGKAQSISKEALKTVKLSERHWKKKIGSYSKGMRQRVKLAQAILHEPKLIILDEPMNGLDPMGRQEIGNILKDLKNSGIHVIISSHILHELESLCNDFVMLNWGRALASGRQSKIRKEIKNWSEQIAIRTNQPQQLAEHLVSLDTLKGYLVEGEELIIWLKRPESFYQKWPEYLVDCEAEVYDVQNKSQTLTSLFERIAQ